MSRGVSPNRVGFLLMEFHGLQSTAEGGSLHVQILCSTLATVTLAKARPRLRADRGPAGDVPAVGTSTVAFLTG